MDIVVYTNPKTLAHKMGLDGAAYADERMYWHFRRFPEKLEDGDRIYFATKGEVRGSFRAEFWREDVGEVDFLVGSWLPLVKDGDASCTVDVSPFRGFRYRWWQ